MAENGRRAPGSEFRAPQPQNPFPGLRPFREDEDYLFFGRETQTAELLTLLRTHRFIAVVGTSGSGKSSLVRAGLLPELQGGTMTAAGSTWDVALLRPGGDPLRNLARALCDADLYDAGDPETLPRLIATLSRSGRGLVEAYRQADVEDGANLLVVVDQFEELFRFRQRDLDRHDVDRGDFDHRDVAQSFVNLLLEASRDTGVPIYIALTMRSDYLGDCPEFRGLAEAVNQGEYLIPRLGRDELRAAIEGPVRVGGAEITDRLVQHLLNGVGDNPDQLPVLQHALMRTWDHWMADHAEGEPIDLRHYEAIGGMEEALSRHADEIWRALADERQQDVAARVFKALTEKGADNRGIRRPTRLRRLERIAGADRDTVTAVIDAYRRSGVTFLMPGEDRELRDRTVIDLSHESLMRVWRRLRDWVEEEAQSARIFRRLAETAALWHEGRAGLYHDPDLQIAQSWRDEYAPNAAWAGQYGGGFERAMEFLDHSREAAEAAAREEEAVRRRELEQARLLARTQARAARAFKHFAGGMAILAVMAAALSVWALRLWDVADELLVESRHEQGKAWLERGRFLLEEQRHLPAKLLAARAIGFEGFGREERDDAFATRWEPLLERRSSEWRNAADLVRFEAEFPLVWQSPSWSVAGPDRRGGAWPDVDCVRFSPDGSLIASAGDGMPLRLWDAATGGVRAVLQGHAGEVNDLSFDRDGRMLASAGADRTVRLWDVETGRETARLDHSSAVGAVAIRADGTLLAAGSADRSVHLWQPRSRREIGRVFHGSPVTTVAFSPDGSLLASGGYNYTIRLHDVESGETESLRHGHTVRRLRFSPDGALLASAGRDGLVRFFAVATRSERAAIETGAAESWALAWSRDGALVATEGRDRSIRIWNVADPAAIAEVATLEGHAARIDALDFSPDGASLVSGDHAGVVHVWDLATGRRRGGGPGGTVTAGHRHAVVAVDIRPDGAQIASASRDGLVRLWSVLSGEQVELLEAHPVSADGVADVTFDPAGSVLATCGRRDHTVRLWDVATGTATASFASHGARRVSFSPDGVTIGFGGEDGIVRVRDVTTGEVRQLTGHSGWVSNVVFSPDGSTLLSAGAARDDGTVRVWDLASGEEIDRVEAHPLGVRDVRYSPDGSMFASAGNDWRIRIWDAASRQPRATLTGHETRVVAIAFSPDGRTLASASPDSTVRLWDPATGSTVAVLDGHAGSVRDVGFSADGLSLVSCGVDHTVRLWEVVRPEVATYADPESRYYDVVAHPDGATLAAGGKGFVRLLDATTGRARAVYRIPEDEFSASDSVGGAVFNQTFSPDGRLLVTSNITSYPSSDIRVWDLDSGRVLTRFSAPRSNVVERVGFSPDGSTIAFAATGSQVRFWNTGTAASEWLQTKVGARSVSFSPDGELVAVGTGGGEVQLWDARTRARVGAWGRHSGSVLRLQFSPGGRMLASGGADQVVLLWDVDGRRLRPRHRLEVEAAGRGVVDLELSPDGQTLVTKAAEAVHLWDVATGEEIARFPDLTGAASVTFTRDGARLLTVASDGALRVLDARVRTRPPSRYAAVLERFRIEGREVEPRFVRNLHEPRSLPLAALSAQTQMALLGKAETEPEARRAILRNLLLARNWTAAVLALGELPAEEREDGANVVVEALLQDAAPLIDRGLLRVALLRLDLAAELAPGSAAVVAERARALRGVGQTAAAFALLDDRIRTAIEADAARAAWDLGVVRLRYRLADRAFDAARGDLDSVLRLGTVASAADRERVVEEYLRAVVAASLADLDGDSSAAATLIAVALVELVVLSGSETDESLLHRLAYLKPVVEAGGATDVELVSRQATWRYHDEGTAPPAGWREVDFDDSAWPSGPAPLGFGDLADDGAPREATTLEKGHMAYYARHGFQLDAVPEDAQLRLDLARDDGALIYLNGQRILADNMPRGEPLPTTRARSIMSNDDEWRLRQFLLDTSGLRPGPNVIAAEVHQANSGSSDIHFELGVTAARTPAAFLQHLDESRLEESLAVAASILPSSVAEEWTGRVRFAYRESVDLDDPLADDRQAWRARRRVQRARSNEEAVLESVERELALLAADGTSDAARTRYRLAVELETLLRSSGRDDEVAARAREWASLELQTAGAIRINCGGDEYTDSDGSYWASDRYFTRGGLSSTQAPITGTDDAPLYQSLRWFRIDQEAPALYRVAVPSGPYRVSLHFCETRTGAEPGANAFDVHVESEPVLDDYDIVRSAGTRAADVRTFDVDVDDGWLEIELAPDVGTARIAAIEIATR